LAEEADLYVRLTREVLLVGTPREDKGGRMDAVTKSPFCSPSAFTDLLLHANFPKEICCAETSARVRHVRFGLVALVQDRLSSLDRISSEPALRKAIPGQDQ